MLRAGEVDVALVYRFLRDGQELDPPTAEVRTSFADASARGPARARRARCSWSRPLPVPNLGERTKQQRRRPAGQPAHADSDPRAVLLAVPVSRRVPRLRAPARRPPGPRSWPRTRASAGSRPASKAMNCCSTWAATPGFSPDVALRTPDFVAAQSLVAAGLGVTIMPGLALRAARHPGIEATALPGACRRILAVTYQAAADSPAARRLIDAIATARSAPPAPVPGQRCRPSPHR